MNEADLATERILAIADKLFAEEVAAIMSLCGVEEDVAKRLALDQYFNRVFA